MHQANGEAYSQKKKIGALICICQALYGAQTKADLVSQTLVFLQNFQRLDLCTRQNRHRDKFRCGRWFPRSIIRQLRKCGPDFRNCLIINLGRATNGDNEICLGVRFALCIIKAPRLARSEHCSGTVVSRFLLPSIHSNGWN